MTDDEVVRAIDRGELVTTGDLQEIEIVEDENVASVFDYPGSGFTEIGMVFPEYMPYEVWEAQVATLQKILKGIQWAVGDALNYGERTYGEIYPQAVDLTGLKVSTLYSMKYVASRFQMGQRRPNLSFAHHAAVASIMDVDPGVALEILDVAEKNGLTEKEVRFDAAQARKDLGMEGTNADEPKYHMPVVNRVVEPGDDAVVEVLADVAWMDDLLSFTTRLAQAQTADDWYSLHKEAVEWCKDHRLKVEAVDESN